MANPRRIFGTTWLNALLVKDKVTAQLIMVAETRHTDQPIHWKGQRGYTQ